MVSPKHYTNEVVLKFTSPTKKNNGNLNSNKSSFLFNKGGESFASPIILSGPRDSNQMKESIIEMTPSL